MLTCCAFCFPDDRMDRRLTCGRPAGMTARATNRQRSAGSVAKQAYDPMLYAHLPSHEIPLPPSDDEGEDARSSTLSLGSGSTQDWAPTQSCGGWRAESPWSYTSLLNEGLCNDDGNAAVDLSVQLSSSSGAAATHTRIINPHPDGDCAEQLWAECGQALRQAGTETITRGLQPLHVDEGDNAAVQEPLDCDDADGDEDCNFDDLPEIRPLASKVRNSGASAKKGPTPRNRRNKKMDDNTGGSDGEGGWNFWSVGDTIALVRVKRDQDVYIVGLGHSLAHMKTREWKWEDVRARLEIMGVTRKAIDCVKKWDNLMQQFKKVHKFQNLSGRKDYFKLASSARRSEGFSFVMDPSVYDDMEAMTKRDHTIHPKNLADTGKTGGVRCRQAQGLEGNPWPMRVEGRHPMPAVPFFCFFLLDVLHVLGECFMRDLRSQERQGHVLKGLCGSRIVADGGGVGGAALVVGGGGGGEVVGERMGGGMGLLCANAVWNVVVTCVVVDDADRRRSDVGARPSAPCYRGVCAPSRIKVVRFWRLQHRRSPHVLHSEHNHAEHPIAFLLLALDRCRVLAADISRLLVGDFFSVVNDHRRGSSRLLVMSTFRVVYNARIPHRGALRRRRRRRAEEEEAPKDIVSTLQGSGCQRSSDHIVARRLVTPPPEAQHVRARDTPKAKEVVDVGGEDDEPLESPRQRNVTRGAMATVVRARGATNKRPPQGGLPSMPSQLHPRNTADEGGSMERGGGGEIQQEARVVGGGGGSLMRVRELQAMWHPRRERERSFQLWSGRWHVARTMRSASACRPPSVVMLTSSTSLTRIVDPAQLQQAISRAAAVENIALRILHGWVFKSGNCPRGYNLVFQYALESVATDIARAMWYGEEWSNVVSAVVCAHAIHLSMDLPLWFTGANIEDRPEDDDMAAYQESTVICIAHAFRVAVQMGVNVDGGFISHDRLSSVANCFRLLLAPSIWLMRMSGDDLRSHYEAFYFAKLFAKPTLVAFMHPSFKH
ncbi:hypothetical protein CBR_g50321 [Chara braunii]|uniref:Myb/SANT-like DNA-binding domain-containing protein n=1 Tax=Chara braunii TaxID=69332 RepID=A0A388K5I4_CHABU|nr:hypothetical protein CBR_g50321 [Chara braunii]|eukprot:GBG65279.1 hypothetical protein CBR_g50321 [Chara braunii]